MSPAHSFDWLRQRLPRFAVECAGLRQTFAGLLCRGSSGLRTRRCRSTTRSGGLCNERNLLCRGSSATRVGILCNDIRARGFFRHSRLLLVYLFGVAIQDGERAQRLFDERCINWRSGVDHSTALVGAVYE